MAWRPTLMHPAVRAFFEDVAEAVELPDPIVEFGSLQVEASQQIDLRSLLPGRAYIGTDFRDGPGVDRVEDLRKLTFGDGEVGTAICLKTLEHVSDPPAACRELTRVVADGVLIVSAPTLLGIHAYPEVPNFGSRARLRSHRFNGWRRLRPLEHINHFTPQTLASAFSRVGLEPVTTASPTYAGPPQTPLECLDDLVRNRWSPLVKRLPTAVAWRLLERLERADDRSGTGMVVLGIAQVPG